MSDFSELTLSPALHQGVTAAEYLEMTPVQAASLPAILAGRDVIAQAMTGSGKTAAFALGLLAAIDAASIRLQGLVLCPTRELADQVSKEIRRLARFIPNLKVLTLCGGIPLRPHLASLAHEPHLVVGTPGRILELLQKGALPLAAIRVLVLDEADRMLDMGFSDDIHAITAQIPRKRQTLLFSATYNDAVRGISRQFQRDALDISVTATLSTEEVGQLFFEVGESARFDTLTSLLVQHRPESALVFCNTRHAVRELATRLAEQGHSVLALHGDLDQRDREEVLLRFANRSCALLVATDVAARGLDIKDMPVVINHDMATTAEVHLHRIGRTGRAGCKGLAWTLCTPHERHRTLAIEELQGTPLDWQTPIPASGTQKPLTAGMVTLVIDGGRQDKLRPGDLLGALTGDAGLAADSIGKIDIYATRAYVAINRRSADQAFRALVAGRIKGRRFRVRRLA
ncbi:MAG: ATP-dependent RNA helicase DbpA [Gammaproteobacteria bacterium]|nr:ATP-dependent RNA helicase DbpA [Gammaproteobacteria bacterium]